MQYFRIEMAVIITTSTHCPERIQVSDAPDFVGWLALLLSHDYATAISVAAHVLTFRKIMNRFIAPQLGRPALVVFLSLMSAIVQPVAAADDVLVRPKILIVDPSLPRAQAESQILAARRY